MPPNFLQSAAWAKMNELIGHKVIAEKFGKSKTYMIVKSAKRGRYLEIPGGPTLDWQNQKAVAAAFSKIKEIARNEKCVFVRFRPQLLKTAENLAKMKALGAKPAPMHLHAEHTVILNLEKSEEELLKNMRRQTRYEVRRAEKLGLKVKSGNSKELFEEFYEVQQETARRQHFVAPNLKTLLAEREAFGDGAQIYVAYISEEPVAYGLILRSAADAAYFEAASTDLNRKLPGAYAIQWQVIKDLKKQGVKIYNLWGIAPPNQPHHRYAGVTTFKTGFGGEVVEFIPAQDIVINQVKYALDYTVETIRKKRRHL